MQPFQVKINNLGKLTDADIRIGSFTVFAGANNTGKSFVSKSLYSIFGAMNANHLAVVFEQHISPLLINLKVLMRVSEEVPKLISKISGEKNDVDSKHLKEMIDAVENLQQIAANTVARNDMDEFGVIEESLISVRNALGKIQDAFTTLKSDIEIFLQPLQMKGGYVNFMDEIKNMEEHVTKLGELKDKDAQYFVVSGLQNEIYQNILHNFQVAKLSDLCNRIDNDIDFNIVEIGKIEIKAQNVDFLVQKSGLHLLQKYSRVLYLESPIFWRMKNPLEKVKKIPSFTYSERQLITRVPKYFYDMADMLRETYFGDHICPEILEKLTGDDVLGGKVAIGETGELLFLEKDKSYPLSLAATGVANLGMLAFLIEKNLMDKNTFLFIDEPEAHLHTAWQVEMAEALFALAKAGVNVVIATHSAEILKWLEVHVKENPDDKKLIALNHFCVDGTVKSNGGNFQDKLDAIQEELANPFYDLYYRGL